MVAYMWISAGLLLVTTALALWVRPVRLPAARAARIRHRLTRLMLGAFGLSCGLLLVGWLSPLSVYEVACPAATAAGLGEACWMLLLWLGRGIPDDDGGDDVPEPDEPDPSRPDRPLLPWDDFDRTREAWGTRDRPRTPAGVA